MEQRVILVNEKDRETGTIEKLLAHQRGLLHRAFSVFIFNQDGEMLLQRRALNKYHSGGLWTNACCSHPGPGEDTLEAAMKRLDVELGFKTTVSKIFDFIYKKEFENGLTEYEFDHVYAGEYSGAVIYNKAEVMDICYMPVLKIKEWMSNHPENFTAWFQLAFPRIESWWINRYKKSEIS